MYQDEYRRWRGAELEDADLAEELAGIAGDDDQIKDRFAIDLSFGTAGLRGVLGAGTNRMNIYTVRRATQGFANYLLKTAHAPSVAIAYDSRIKSDLFARETAAVFAANGLRVHLYPALMPVPALSFAVRHLHAAAGVMVTASHNPAKYNGYKAYGPDGCQINTETAAAVLAEIEKLDLFTGPKTMPFDAALEQGLVQYIPESVPEAYYQNVLAQTVRPGLAGREALRIVYSPLNGAGNVPVRHVLAAAGFASVTVVPEQEKPDGNFPTCPYPNPEIRDTLALGLALGGQTEADLVLATDPDADRVGVAARGEDGAWHLLSGNEMGVLLLDYIIRGRRAAGTLPKDALCVRSIVSTPMADEVAAKNGVEMVQVLTGFKYIGEQILQLEQKGEAARFIFGFEESYGYLAGTYVRDKDAVVASMLICEMAAYYKEQGQSLYDAMAALYREYGRYLNSVDNFAFEGLAGMQQMANIMAGLRKNPPKEVAGLPVLAVADYETGTAVDCMSGNAHPTGLPASDVLLYTLAGGASVIVRPSGTEPKIKVYYATRGSTLADAEALQRRLAAALAPLMR